MRARALVIALSSVWAAQAVALSVSPDSAVLTADVPTVPLLFQFDRSQCPATMIHEVESTVVLQYQSTRYNVSPEFIVIADNASVALENGGEIVDMSNNGGTVSMPGRVGFISGAPAPQAPDQTVDATLVYTIDTACNYQAAAEDCSTLVSEGLSCQGSQALASRTESTAITVTLQGEPGPGPGPGNGGTSNLFPEVYDRLSPAEQSMADTISFSCPRGEGPGRNTAALQADCNALVGEPDAGTQEAIFGQITPTELDTAAQSAERAMKAGVQNVGRRMAALRAGARGFSARGLAINLDGGRVSGEVLEALAYEFADPSGGAAGDDILATARWGVFVNGDIGRVTRSSSTNVDGFKTDIRAVTAGADYRLQDNLVLGAAVSYQVGDTSIADDGGSLDVKGYGLTLYGLYFQDDMYLEGYVTGGRNRFDQDRRVRYTETSGRAVDQVLRADYDGDQYGFGARVGYDFNMGEVTITPSVALDYLKLKVDGFSESASSPGAPGSGWETTIESQDYTSLTSSVGVNVSYASSQNWGVLMPYAGVEWVHEFKGSSRDIQGFLSGDGSNTRFSIPTDSEDSNYFNVNVGAVGVFDDGVSAYVGYRRTFGQDHYRSYAFTAGLRMEF